MSYRGLLLSLCVLLGGLCGAARGADGEVVLRPSNQGQVFIEFPDQTIDRGQALA